MSTWKYHTSSASMTAEAADRAANPGRSSKVAHVNPVHVRLHRGLHRMYANWAATRTHHVTLSVSEAPSRPIPRQLQRKGGGQDPRAGRHDALRLQELLDGEVGRVREDLRDEAVRELRGGAGDLRRLAEQQEERLREGAHDGERHAGGHQQHRRALQVHAQHIVLLRAVRLPAQRLHRAVHTQLPHMRVCKSC
jgi:hypothetical protein